jgi:alpha-beta hydrolase superfamily lysophospholipase
MRDDHFTFRASDGEKLFVYRWRPDVGVGKALVQICHGLAEHAGRYERLAEELTQNGFLVYAHDQRGHGRTAQSAEATGYFADHNGWSRIVQDVIELGEAEKQEYPRLPRVIFGHSMGTFVVQQIIYQRPHLFDGVIMSGPNGVVSPLVQVGKLVTRIERWRLGKHGRSELINSLSFDSYNRAFKPNRTSFDWLSRDEAEVDKYIADPMCGFLASTELWMELLMAIPEVARTENRRKIRKDMPIFLFSGGDDPVNDNGRGCESLGRTYREMGIRNVSYKIYPFARHETLHETNREQVTRDVVEWLECVRALFPAQ